MYLSTGEAVIAANAAWKAADRAYALGGDLDHEVAIADKAAKAAFKAVGEADGDIVPAEVVDAAYAAARTVNAAVDAAWAALPAERRENFTF